MVDKTQNIWVLTEERPKIEVLRKILIKFAEDYKSPVFIGDLRILPVLKDGKFAFVYELIGFRSCKIKQVLIKTVSGNSSFVDFLVFFQDKEPVITDCPIYAIEETKTDDSESRNTGVYQRCSKFVYVNHFYPNAKKIMLYNLQIKQKENPTETNIFGTRMLLTMGVEILGKQLDKNIFIPFCSIDELILFKNNMRKPPKGNVPICIKKFDDKIEISGRLYKSGGLSHDPNIGALSIISNVLRLLGWKKDIIITKHGLQQKYVGKSNKFIFIANLLDIKLDGLYVPETDVKDEYWHYDTKGEKLATIFLHLVIDSFSGGYSIFENHAGCEKGYFITSTGDCLPLVKYVDRDAYKAGDKSQIINIPDLVLVDNDRQEIIDIEGKKYENKKIGIAQIKLYDAFDKIYVKKYYADFVIKRTVVLYGGHDIKIVEIEVGFLLNECGDLVLGIKAPSLFVEAITNLRDFWNI